MTWTDWLDAHVARDDVRQLLLAFSRLSTYANHPQRLSAQAALDQLRLATRGVLYLDGGWQSLVEGLLARAHEAGVDVRTRAAVAEVEGHPRSGASVSRRAAACRQTSFSSPSIAMPRRVSSRAVRSSRGRPAPPCPCGRPRSTWRSGACPAPAVTFALGLDRPLYFSVHSQAARLAPRGRGPRPRVDVPG